MIEFGQVVRELRKSCGMTQAELARAITVDLTYISKIENGKTQMLPIEELIRRMAIVLRVQPDHLLDVAGKIDVLKLRDLAAKSPLLTSILRRIQRGLTDEQIRQILDILNE